MRQQFIQLFYIDNTTLNSGTGGDVIASDDISGVKFQRIKLIFGPDGTNEGDASTANPFPAKQVYKNRVDVNYFSVGAAAGTTGVETMITLTKSSGTGATSTGTSFVITSGKIYKITSITFGSRGNATATVQITTHTLRVNPAGATIATSNQKVSGRTATPATALAWDRLSIAMSDGLEYLGDGTLTFGVSANAVFVTNAPTWDVLITGFEYTP